MRRQVYFPCDIGQTVYFIKLTDVKPKLIETKIEKLILKSTGLYMKLLCNAAYETSCNSIGKTVFFEKEDAEDALKNF